MLNCDFKRTFDRIWNKIKFPTFDFPRENLKRERASMTFINVVLEHRLSTEWTNSCSFMKDSCAQQQVSTTQMSKTLDELNKHTMCQFLLNCCLERVTPHVSWFTDSEEITSIFRICLGNNNNDKCHTYIKHKMGLPWYHF